MSVDPLIEKAVEVATAGDLTGAHAVLDEAAATEPDDPAVLRVRSWLLGLDDRWAEAAEIIGSYLDAHPAAVPELWVELAKARQQLGEHAAADEAIAKAVGVGGLTCEAWKKIVEIRLDQERPHDALAAAAELCALAPHERENWQLRATAAAGAGEFREAAASLDRAVNLGAHDARMQALAAKFHRLAGDASAALAAAKRAVELEPEDGTFWSELGLARREVGDSEGALEAMRRAAALDDSSEAIWYNLGSVTASAGNLSDAVSCFRRAVELEPNAPENHKALAECLAAEGEVEEAIATLDNAAAIMPDEALIALTRVQLLTEALHDYGRALDEIDAVMPDLTGDLRGYGLLQRMVALNGAGRSEEVLAIEDVARLAPHLADAAALQRAIALNRMGRHEDALEVLETLGDTLRGLRAAVALQRGWALLSLDRPTAAIEAMEALDGSDLGATWEARVQRAVAYNKVGDHAAALRILNGAEATVAGEGLVAIRTQQFVAYERSGNLDAALGCLDALMEIRPDEAVEFLQTKIRLLGNDGRSDDALDAVDAFAASVPPESDEYRDAWVMRLHLESRLRGLNRALAWLDAFEEAHPELRLVAEDQRCNVLMQHQRTDDALRVMQQIADAGQDDIQSAEDGMLVAMMQAVVGDARAQATLDQAVALDPAIVDHPAYPLAEVALLRAGARFDAALDVLERWNPPGMLFPVSLNLKVQTLKDLGRPNDALSVLDESLALFDEHPHGEYLKATALLARGWILLELGRPEEAKAAFAEVESEDSEADMGDMFRVAAVTGMAIIAWTSNELIEALRLSKDAVERVRMHGEYTIAKLALSAWLIRAAILADAERHDEALQAWREVQQRDPDNVDAMTGEATALLELEDPERALQTATTAIGLATSDADRLRLRKLCGRSLNASGDHNGAASAFREAIHLAPDDSPVWIALADSYRQDRRYRAAASAYQMAWECRVAKQDALAIALGLSATLLGDTKPGAALDFLTDNQQSLPEDSRVEFNRGIALYQLDKTRDAIVAFERAGRLQPRLPEAAQNARALRGVRIQADNWVDFWFGPGKPPGRRLAGSFLVAVFIAMLVVAVAEPSRVAWLSWMATEREWPTIALPLAVVGVLLVLPTVTHLKVGPVELERTPSIAPTHVETLPPKAATVAQVMEMASRAIESGATRLGARQSEPTTFAKA